MRFRACSEEHRRGFVASNHQIIMNASEPIGRLFVHRDADELRIIDLALVPEHRGRRVGGALIRRLLAEADAVGLPERPHVERDNPALRLYTRLGFATIGGDAFRVETEHAPNRDGMTGSARSINE